MQSTVTEALKEAFSHAPETFLCSCCNEEHPAEECYYMDEEEICESCYDENTVVCNHCDARIWNDDNAGSDSTPLCQRCFDNHYTTCERCGCVISNDDASYDDDDDYPYCEACYERYSVGTIHDYGYKPEPIFYGDGSRFMGVELEIDGGGKDGSNAREMLAVANRDGEHIYIKSDSSLDDGLELVSNPMTLEYHRNNMPWSDVANRALALGYLSHKSDTCGLHIHVNRDSFSDDMDKQEECISRVLFFVERFWEELLRFSRRTEYQLQRWAKRYGAKGDPKEILDAAKQGYADRYRCVNITNYHTIEFRIFRGSLKYNTIIATLQMVDAICEVAFSMSDKELTALSWCSFVEHLSHEKYPELITYLKERRLYVNEPIIYEEDE